MFMYVLFHVSTAIPMYEFLGYQHIRMYDLNSNNPNPTINYDGISKNVTAVGFHEEGKWMFTGGEDNSARIWDLRCALTLSRNKLLYNSSALLSQILNEQNSALNSQYTQFNW